MTYPFKNTSISKWLFDSDARFGFRTSFPKENRRSTAALEGIGVLYFTNNSINNLHGNESAAGKEEESGPSRNCGPLEGIAS